MSLLPALTPRDTPVGYYDSAHTPAPTAFTAWVEVDGPDSLQPSIHPAHTAPRMLLFPDASDSSIPRVFARVVLDTYGDQGYTLALDKGERVQMTDGVWFHMVEGSDLMARIPLVMGREAPTYRAYLHAADEADDHPHHPHPLGPWRLVLPTKTVTKPEKEGADEMHQDY